MIRRIELVNFMSHVHTVLEPADGLTVLVGPNNCGKSAVVAALQILCHNDNSTYVMRHNERECSVTVETDDGHCVQWRRRGAPAYFVDGQEYSRLDRGFVPDEVQHTLRLPKVTSGGDREFDVHFGEQKSPVFLLDKPGSHAAQFFASSSDAASLVEMQKRHQQKMQDARSERRRLEASAVKLDAELAILAASDQITLRMTDVESQHAALIALATNIALLIHDLHMLEQSLGVALLCGAETEALAALGSPPIPEPIEPVSEAITQLQRTQAELTLQQSTVQSLAPLQLAPELADEAPLAHLVRNIQLIQRCAAHAAAEADAAYALVAPPMLSDEAACRTHVWELVVMSSRVAASHAMVSAASPLSSPPELSGEAAMADDLQAMMTARRSLDRSLIVVTRLAHLTPPPAVADSAPISQLTRDLLSSRAAALSHDTELASIEQALSNARHDANRLAQQHPVCPTCGGVLDAAHVLSHSARQPPVKRHAEGDPRD